ncbi:hypothetical protein JOF29_002920 [Kribbella aluminosa]|uniref:Uncharacterized protein n=1 Tax=Kribbella aluminosa TaxID=416017 RepID=A0ABS4UJL9_9ACTN|nr:hypothetical protein [Kribbella aluminosa]
MPDATVERIVDAHPEQFKLAGWAGCSMGN